MDKSIFAFQADFCKAMGNPVRLQVVYTLRDRPKTVSEIARETNLPQSTVSRQLGVLRGIGVVTYQRHGTELHYTLADPQIGEVCDLVSKVLLENLHRRSQIIG